ncbi:MAG: hypothetical protein ACTSWL_05925 [Promethearchaeota archaeon]
MALDLTSILNTIYMIIEKILPILLPFMKFTLPLLVIIGGFLKIVIGQWIYPIIPIDSVGMSLIPWYIIGGVVVLISIVLAILKPMRKKK